MQITVTIAVEHEGVVRSMSANVGDHYELGQTTEELMHAALEHAAQAVNELVELARPTSAPRRRPGRRRSPTPRP